MYKVIVNIENDPNAWEKSKDINGQYTGSVKINSGYLKKVVEALKEALEQAESQLEFSNS